MNMLDRIKEQMLPFASLLGIEFVSAAADRIVARRWCARISAHVRQCCTAAR